MNISDSRMKSLERYRDIEGYEGSYQVTSWGRVWSVKANKFMTPETTDKGYLRIKLKKNKETKNHKVHRLVAKAFLSNPNHLAQVNHIDGNKLNNSITNLEWVTDKENKEHAATLRSSLES